MAYPATYDDFNISGNPIRNDLVSRLSQLYDAVEAIEHELGLSPSSTFATVVARLDDMQQQLDDLEASVAGQISTAIDSHTDGSDPHPVYGKIITPSNPNGNGTWYIGGSPSSSGTDYVGWVDTAS